MADEDKELTPEQRAAARRKRTEETVVPAIEGGRRGDQRNSDKRIVQAMGAALAADGRAPSGRPQTEQSEEDSDQ
ncbi:MAG TPA: hypothetical protein VLI05_00195 [Candidatus Saccharimonadia bacterium]|nr:hypothetical protein [Candidatus Saccharimonadia bacterium]